MATATATATKRAGFISAQPFEEARIRAASIYCSDGRFGEQMDDFLLIAHDRCAFYREWLKIPAQRLEERQKDDLNKTAARVRIAQPNLRVEAYFARRRDPQIWFESITLSR
jgi:hypothetical protein